MTFMALMWAAVFAIIVGFSIEWIWGKKDRCKEGKPHGSFRFHAEVEYYRGEHHETEVMNPCVERRQEV